jgi:CDP-diacylglycerol--serine O-phosphatidyltransferase
MNIQNAKYILPNLFTLGSVFLGLQAIAWSFDAQFAAAGIAILGAAILDGMDGRVARLTRTQSDFGTQLDSLADAISFGVAPAFLAYQYALVDFRIGEVSFGLLVVAVFAICGVLRLARFNVLAQRAPGAASSHFVGLPIPGAAALVVLTVLSAERTHVAFLRGDRTYIVLLLLLSALMVSTVRYPSFKKVRWSRRHVLVALLGATLLTLGLKLVSLFPALLLAGTGYIAYGLLDTLLRRIHARDARDPADDPSDAVE